MLGEEQRRRRVQRRQRQHTDARADARSDRAQTAVLVNPSATFIQGLTLAHCRAQLEDLQDTSLTLKLNLSTFGTHPQVR
jgi:hypothetical protein